MAHVIYRAAFSIPLSEPSPPRALHSLADLAFFDLAETFRFTEDDDDEALKLHSEHIASEDFPHMFSSGKLHEQHLYRLVWRTRTLALSEAADATIAAGSG